MRKARTQTLRKKADRVGYIRDKVNNALIKEHIMKPVLDRVFKQMMFALRKKLQNQR